MIRTFERGVEDFTYACGTGTGSLVALLTVLGQVSGQGVQVENLGGRLLVDAEASGGQESALFLTGPAKGKIVLIDCSVVVGSQKAAARLHKPV